MSNTSLMLRPKDRPQLLAPGEIADSPVDEPILTDPGQQSLANGTPPQSCVDREAAVWLGTGR